MQVSMVTRLCSNSDNRQAVLQDSYFALEKDETSGRTKRSLQPIILRNIKVRNSLAYNQHDIDILQYTKARPVIRLQPVSSVASFMNRLVGPTRGTQGRIHFVWQMDSYVSISELQEAADNVEWELEDMI